MTRKQSECGLLRHPSSFFSTTPLKKQLSSLRKPRSNMTVSKLPFYSSISNCNCVLSLYSSSFPCVTHIYFLLTSDLPPDSKLHNLLSLTGKDIESNCCSCHIGRPWRSTKAIETVDICALESTSAATCSSFMITSTSFRGPISLQRGSGL